MEPLADQTQKELELGEYRQLEGFEETNPKKTTRHFKHPIDPSEGWCGTPISDKTYVGTVTSDADKIDCVDCLHLFINKTGNWWWNVHQAWYGSMCSPSEGHAGCQ